MFSYGPMAWYHIQNIVNDDPSSIETGMLSSWSYVFEKNHRVS